MSTTTHSAVATVSPGAPFSLISVPTPQPTGNKVQVRVLWTASTPPDWHQNGGHLLVKPPEILSDGVAGFVTAVDPTVKNLKVGNAVFGFTFKTPKEKAYQEFCASIEENLGIIPSSFGGRTEEIENRMQEAVTLPNNFVTAWHVLTSSSHFKFELSWPKPEGYAPPASQRDTWS